MPADVDRGRLVALVVCGLAWAVLGLWWVVTLLRVDGPGSVGTVLLAVVHGVLVGCLSFAAWLAPAFLVLHAVRGTTPR